MKKSTPKRFIKSFRGILWVQIGNCFVRKDCIEIVNEEVVGEVKFRTVSGSEFTLMTRQAKDILYELCFNEK